MSLQVLVATMHQTDCSLLEKMNIQSDAIVVNQCDRNEFEEFNYHGHKIRFLSFAERGVGLNRNNALMRATADIVLFADDDMVYVDNYPSLVIKEFESNPKADVILFGLESLNQDRPLLEISARQKVSRREALKYGCARIAARRERLLLRNIWFSHLFGGGAKYSSGEDTIFLQDCIKRGLKIYKSPAKIAYVQQEGSSWFKGYDDKYYFDKGVLMATIMPVFCWVYAFATALKVVIKKSNNVSCLNILKLLFEGIKHQKSLKRK